MNDPSTQSAEIPKSDEQPVSGMVYFGDVEDTEGAFGPIPDGASGGTFHVPF
jgi:hypothetical protein